MIRLPFGRGKGKFAGAIGVEFSLEYLHLVQLEHLRNSVTLRAAKSVRLEAGFEEMLQDEVLFKNTVSRALKDNGFTGRRAVVAMPSSMTRVMSVNYQVNPGQSEGAAIMQLMRDRIGDELASFVVDYMPINRESNSRDRASLIAMCSKEMVMQYLELLRKSGLKAEAMEIGPVAIKRLVDSLQEPGDDKASLVVNCGRAKSYITLISRKRILADDEVDYGEQTILEQISKALDVDEQLATSLLRDAELGAERPDDETHTLIEIIRPELNKLVKEIERGLVYAASESRGNAEANVYLIGSMARWNGADELLSSLVNHPVTKIPDPLQSFIKTTVPQGASTTDGRPELAIAAGLALRDFHHG